MPNQESAAIIAHLKSLATEERRLGTMRFFKTGPGEYGEGDQFLGVTLPQTRAVIKPYLKASTACCKELLCSPWHEVRMAGLLIMVDQFKQAKDVADRTMLHRLYLSHTAYVNNWDLVDTTAPTLVGEYLLDRPHGLLYRLVESESLWEQRIAVLATFAFIKRHDFVDILELCRRLLTHEHDLMHKACGWMLREVGKRDEAVLLSFLEEFTPCMPRTMLRYAIERLSPELRQRFLHLPRIC